MAFTETPNYFTSTIDAADFPIKSVKISKSLNAEVVRPFCLQLKKGQNALEIKGLSSHIGIVRPAVSGTVARIDDFLFTVERSAASVKPGVVAFGATPSSGTIPESLRVLLVREAALQSQRRVKELESELLLKYGQSLSGEHLTPNGMTAFLESFSEHSHKAIQETTAINESIVDIQREIEAEKARLALQAGETLGRVMIMITAEQETEADLTLTYIVNKCEWRPTYELHATTENGKPSEAISLHYLALVSQSTGEDWTGAELTLSTIASDLSPKRIPRSAALKIRPAGTPAFGPTPPNPGANFNRGSGLFSNPHSQQGYPTTTSLFGSTGGLFGQQPQQTQQNQQQQQQQQQQQAPSNTQAFGAAGAYGSTQPPAASNGTLFGAGRGTGLFGQPQPAAQAPPINQPSSLFGGGGPTATRTSQSTFDSSAPPAGDLPPADEPEHETSFDALSEASSVVRETPLSMVFVVNGVSSIPSDGLHHRVTLAVLPFKFRTSYITIPRDDPTVFLQCAVTNTSEYRLLSGPMSVIMDESYISSTTLDADINPGEVFECRLGADISTKVTYTRTSKAVDAEHSAFAEETDTTVFTTKISVHNRHAFDLADLVVRDRMPTCDDKRVKVILRHPLHLGKIKDGAYAGIGEDGLKVGWEKLVDGKGGEKEGKFEWKWSVKSGEQVDFFSDYEVKAPRGAGWVVQPVWSSLFGR